MIPRVNQRASGKLESWNPIIDNPIETEKSDARAEIVEVVDDRGYSRFVSGCFMVPRRYFFGLITLQEPFDPQRDLGWGLRWLTPHLTCT